MTTTTNLEKFGYRELKMLEELLRAMREQGLPDNFDTDQVHPMFNQDSGYVFLTNRNFEVALMNGDKLEVWHSCAYCGHEGFLEDFEHDPIHEDCKEQMHFIGVSEYQDYITTLE